MPSKPKKPAAPKGDFVGKAEFEAFQQSVLGLLEKMAVAAPVAPVVTGQAAAVLSEEDGSAEASNGFMPPQYQKLFEKYFDPADGFESRIVFPEIDEKGNESGGIMFTIVVPKKFSNVEEAHAKFYKQDLRSKALRPGSIAKGIEDWCKLVTSNLKYNRNIKIK